MPRDWRLSTPSRLKNYIPEQYITMYNPNYITMYMYNQFQLWLEKLRVIVVELSSLGAFSYLKKYFTVKKVELYLD